MQRLDNLVTESGLLPGVLLAGVDEVPVDTVPAIQPTIAPTFATNRCVAIGWGDPHFITFDGLKYDCQADGEVILAQSLDSDFMIQGRFLKVGFPTVTTGVVVRPSSTQPTVQVSMSTDPGARLNFGGCPVVLYVDGTSRNLAQGSGNPLVEVTTSGPSITVVYPTFDSSVTLHVSSYRGVCYFSVRYVLPEGCLDDEQLVGILGSPNGDHTDDWMTRNGTVLPGPSVTAAYF